MSKPKRVCWWGTSHLPECVMGVMLVRLNSCPLLIGGWRDLADVADDEDDYSNASGSEKVSISLASRSLLSQLPLSRPSNLALETNRASLISSAKASFARCAWKNDAEKSNPRQVGKPRFCHITVLQLPLLDTRIAPKVTRYFHLRDHT